MEETKQERQERKRQFLEYTEQNRSFCVKGFGAAEIRAAGPVAPCCDARPSFRPYGVNSHTLDEIFANPEWVKLRQDMLEGVPNSRCRMCYRNEEIGIRSQRQNSNDLFWEDGARFLETATANTHELVDLDIKIGNVCNQMCVICDSASSSMMRDEDEVIWGAGKGVILHDKWWRDQNTWTDMLKKCEKIKRINVYGGEPLLIKEMKGFLKSIVDAGLAPGIDINFATNGSIYDEEFFDIIQEFNKRTILASGDGHKKVFEYTRYPANWDQYLENVHLIKSRMQEGDFLAKAYTYSMYSVFDVIDACEFYKTQVDFDFPIWLNPVNQLWYAVESLPDQLKELLIERIEDTYDRDYLLSGSKDLSPIVAHIRNERVEKNWVEFKRITKTRDRLRNISVLDVVPEFKDYWNED